MTRVSIPAAVQPFYACVRRNQPVVLFRGRVDLAGTSGTERHRGGIVLDWLPSPALRCWVRGQASELGMQSVLGGAEVKIIPRLPRRRVPQQFKTTGGGPRSGPWKFETGSRLLGVECGDTSALLSYALIHLVNFPKLHGRHVAWPDGSIVPGRLRFEGGGWTIVVDPAPGTWGLHDELRDNGGFALTHTARAQRTSGGTFTTAEVLSLVEAFTYFCWLCAEARCGPVLPVGFDGQDRAVWSRWNPTRTESFSSAVTWLDVAHAGEAEALFPTFMARFADPYWRGVVRHAVEYLIGAGRPDTVQSAVVMTQILLETLSYSWLVEERAIRSHASFERHKAAENIRAMLADMRIPVAVPVELSALAAISARDGRLPDGPLALVLTRNEIIHRRRRGETGPPDPAPLIDAWRLGAWYSELAVLRLCGFAGFYRSRLSDNVWTGAVEMVPWRRAAPVEPSALLGAVP